MGTCSCSRSREVLRPRDSVQSQPHSCSCKPGLGGQEPVRSMPPAVPGRSATPEPNKSPTALEALRGLPRIPAGFNRAYGVQSRLDRGSGGPGRQRPLCPGQPPLTEQACLPSHLLCSGETGAADRTQWAAADLDQGNLGDIGTPSDCGWTGGHSLRAREVFGNSTPPLVMPQARPPLAGPHLPAEVQPHPHTQADRH